MVSVIYHSTDAKSEAKQLISQPSILSPIANVAINQTVTKITDSSQNFSSPEKSTTINKLSCNQDSSERRCRDSPKFRYEMQRKRGDKRKIDVWILPDFGTSTTENP